MPPHMFRNTQGDTQKCIGSFPVCFLEWDGLSLVCGYAPVCVTGLRNSMIGLWSPWKHKYGHSDTTCLCTYIPVYACVFLCVFLSICAHVGDKHVGTCSENTRRAPVSVSVSESG